MWRRDFSQLINKWILFNFYDRFHYLKKRELCLKKKIAKTALSDEVGLLVVFSSSVQL